MLAKLAFDRRGSAPRIACRAEVGQVRAEAGREKVLRDLFEKNVEMFNGARMQARHILIAAADGKRARPKPRRRRSRNRSRAEVAPGASQALSDRG